ncbi:MAG: ATP-binding protein [Bryobacterales bacterium]|nr:ATP-binding protein [Bryobacterales bacterium]
MLGSRFYRRSIELRLGEALQDSPVVLIHGPRQCGKTTLAQYMCAPDFLDWEGGRLTPGDLRPSPAYPPAHRDYKYVSLDDPVARDSARDDPLGFVAALPERVVLDEIQRAPEVFEAIKIAVDRKRVPGRFLLTGSSNVLLLPQLSESLAGRLQIVRLHPLAQAELARPLPSPGPPAGFLDALFGGGFPASQAKRLGESLLAKVVAGGFPPALSVPTARRQSRWYRDYIEILIQRDLRDISRIRSLDILPKLVSAAASQTAQLFNLSDLASPFELARPAIGNYITVLERLFVLERLPAWHSSRLKRLVKRPKCHLVDTGIAAALRGADVDSLKADRELLGRLLETFAFQELRRQATWFDPPAAFSHFRTKDGAEVDIVIELPSGSMAGVEIKASATVRSRDFAGLRRLAAAVGKRFVRGAVLYDGETCAPFGDQLYAVPMRRVWETP